MSKEKKTPPKIKGLPPNDAGIPMKAIPKKPDPKVVEHRVEQVFRIAPEVQQGFVWLTRIQFDALPELDRPPAIKAGRKWKTARNRIKPEHAPDQKHHGRLLDVVAGESIDVKEAARRMDDEGPDWYMGCWSKDGTKIEWLPIFIMG